VTPVEIQFEFVELVRVELVKNVPLLDMNQVQSQPSQPLLRCFSASSIQLDNS
jgi:hypothetical protein